MGKRSAGAFAHRVDDFYPTPRKLVVPLIHYLRASGIHTVIEPCAGDGALVRHLESFGLRCVYSGDISRGQDALACELYGVADAIITNPPHTRMVMHPLIAHFQRIAPTWLLIDYDWAAIQQSAPYLQHCSDIVPIGRAKWIEDSKYSGKDNFAWYRFEAGHSGPAALHRWRGKLCMQCAELWPECRCATKHIPRRNTLNPVCDPMTAEDSQ